MCCSDCVHYPGASLATTYKHDTRPVHIWFLFPTLIHYLATLFTFTGLCSHTHTHTPIDYDRCRVSRQTTIHARLRCQMVRQRPRIPVPWQSIIRSWRPYPISWYVICIRALEATFHILKYSQHWLSLTWTLDITLIFILPTPWTHPLSQTYYPFFMIWIGKYVCPVQ